jgi:hypothetical protein
MAFVGRDADLPQAMEPQRNLQGIGRKETRNFHQRRDIAKGLGLRSLLEADVHRCWPPVTPQETLSERRDIEKEKRQEEGKNYYKKSTYPAIMLLESGSR